MVKIFQHDLRDPVPITDFEASFAAVSGYLQRVAEKLPAVVSLVGGEQPNEIVCGMRDEGYCERVAEPITWSVIADDDMVELVVYVHSASEDDLPSLLTRMCIMAVLVASGARRRPRQLTVVVAKVFADHDQSPRYGPLGRIKVSDRIAGKGVATLLECRLEDLTVVWATGTAAA